MATIFITGVAGFLGSHLADAMLALGHKVIGIDNMIGGSYENIPRGVEFVEMDCCDFRRVREHMRGVDVLVHCAATAYEGLSVFSPHLVTRNIVDASVSCFSAAIAQSVRRIVFCSSMARYGAGLPPFRESDTPIPRDPYGIGKLSAEAMLLCLCDVHGVEWSIAVPHNIIGPRQKYNDPYRNVASIFLNLMMQGRSPIIYGDGSQKRCFSYVDDCLSCLTRMAFDPHCAGQVINIGPDEHELTIRELFELCASITGYKGAPVYLPDRPQEVKNAYCSSDKARALLDYRTRTSLPEGLLQMYKAMVLKGPKAFDYHLDLEIVTKRTPRTWTDRLF
jgi:UDP-glucose 4-epimerase